MANCLVTGAGGFIGSHLCEALLKRGHKVIGADAFVPYYPRELKEHNLANIISDQFFSFHEIDLRVDDLSHLVDDVDVIIHLAAMPGLLRSWSDFELYMTCNVLATQRLLEAAKNNDIRQFIHGSTSSVYGQYATGDETSNLNPVSPYGITKLAAENLCHAYAESFNLPVTILRFFSVYGPRQRPDMGYHIFIRALLNDEDITIQGSGTDSRSNTYVLDCVKGILLAFEKQEKSIGEVFNIGGGEEVSVNQVLAILERLTGKTARIKYGKVRSGDQKRTCANITKARHLLNYSPSVSIVEGLANQLDWYRVNNK